MMTMKRLITFACSLALVGACSNTPEQGIAANQLTSTPSSGDAARPVSGAAPGKPIATTGVDGTPAVPSTTSSNPVKNAFGGGSEYREVTLRAGTVLPVDLEPAVGSDTSRVEQPVSGRL